MDVMIIAAGFVLRVAAGVSIISVERFSPWLYVVMTLFALYMGFGKRRAELALLEKAAQSHRRGAGRLHHPFPRPVDHDRFHRDHHRLQPVHLFGAQRARKPLHDAHHPLCGVRYFPLSLPDPGQAARGSAGRNAPDRPPAAGQFSCCGVSQSWSSSTFSSSSRYASHCRHAPGKDNFIRRTRGRLRPPGHRRAGAPRCAPKPRSSPKFAASPGMCILDAPDIGLKTRLADLAAGPSPGHACAPCWQASWACPFPRAAHPGHFDHPDRGRVGLRRGDFGGDPARAVGFPGPAPVR